MRQSRALLLPLLLLCGVSHAQVVTAKQHQNALGSEEFHWPKEPCNEQTAAEILGVATRSHPVQMHLIPKVWVEVLLGVQFTKPILITSQQLPATIYRPRDGDDLDQVLCHQGVFLNVRFTTNLGARFNLDPATIDARFGLPQAMVRPDGFTRVSLHGRGANQVMVVTSLSVIDEVQFMSTSFVRQLKEALQEQVGRAQ